MSKTLAQSLARALNVSQESVDVDINIGSDAVTDEDGAVISPLAPATDEPIIEAQETELVEEESSIDEAVEGDTETEGDIETLESIHQHLKGQVESGGMDTPTYEMFNIAMSHIYRKHNISVESVFPSMEAFGDDKLGQTEISMERVGQTLKTIKDNGAQFLKELWFKLKQFVANLVKMNFSMTKRTAAVSKAAASVKDVVANPDDIKLFAANKLFISGKVPDAATIQQTYKVMADNVNGLSSAIADNVNLFVEEQEAILNNDGVADVTDVERIVEELDKKNAAFANLSKTLRFQDVQIEKVSFGITGSKSIVPGVKLVTGSTPSLSESTVRPLTPKEIVTICSQIDGAIGGLKAIEALYTNKKVEAMIVKSVDDKATKEPTEDGNGEKIKKTEVTKAMKKSIKCLLSLIGKLLSYYAGINKAMLDYCAQSLQAATKGKETVKSIEAPVT